MCTHLYSNMQNVHMMQKRLTYKWMRYHQMQYSKHNILETRNNKQDEYICITMIDRLLVENNWKFIYISIILSYLSNVSSSKLFKSQAIYSKAASVILEHQLRSKERSLGKFSAINSTPSSVTLLHPESDSTVRLGKECTKTKTNILI